jgi:hypothetical protein
MAISTNQKRSQRKRLLKVKSRRQRRREEARDLHNRIAEAFRDEVLDALEQASMFDFVDDVLDIGSELDYDVDDPMDDWSSSDSSEPEEPYADLDWWYGWDDY